MYEKLFTPGKIGNITVKNRLVMSPMGIGLAELDGSPSEDMLAFYEARAMGGAGLIIPEITRVNDVHGAGLMRQLSVTQDRHIPGMARLARFVRRAVNPYCFSVGGVGVKIEFAEGGPSLQETLAAFLIRQKSGL